MRSQTDEEPIHYWDGVLHGAVLGISRYRPGDRDFDHEKWQDLYGSRLIYDSVPHYPPDAESKSDGGPTLTTWDDETETLHLKEGVEPLRDRNGTMIFEDGTVVRMFRGEDPAMFTISEKDVEFFDRLSEKRIEAVRDCYDYDR